MREQTVKRASFDQDDKVRILEKSGGRCAHCGTTLTKETATIDHVIPISKGGTNENSNLVALCHKCNREKDDEVINPAVYYKYLPEKYTKILKQRHEEYCEDVSWLTTRNYMKEDRVEVSYMATSMPLMGRRVKKNGMVMARCLRASAILYKARYEDLDEIMDYLKRYHKKFELDDSYLEEAIADTYKKGCIYALKRGDEILAVFPVKVSKRYIVNPDKESYIVCLSGVPVLYQKREYVSLVDDCIHRILAGVGRANGKNIVLFEISYPEKDEYIKDLVEKNEIYGYSKSQVDEDGWKSTIFCQRWESFKGELSGQDFDPNEDTEYFSQALERIMNLKSIQKEDEKANIQELQKKAYKGKQKNHRIARERRIIRREMIDEYDERYYM